MPKVTRDDLIGSWRLDSWRIEYSDGRPTSYPFGEDAEGRLVYTDELMIAVIHRAGRPPISNPNIRRAPETEKAKAFDDFFCYAGPWRIEGEYVIHTVEHALNPNFVGSEQVRLMDFAGDRLELSATERTAGGAEMRNRLIWWR